MAKTHAADTSWESANAAVRRDGGYGLAEGHDVGRKLRENRLYQVTRISTNLLFPRIEEHVLALPRS